MQRMRKMMRPSAGQRAEQGVQAEYRMGLCQAWKWMMLEEVLRAQTNAAAVPQLPSGFQAVEGGQQQHLEVGDSLQRLNEGWEEMCQHQRGRQGHCGRLGYDGLH